ECGRQVEAGARGFEWCTTRLVACDRLFESGPGSRGMTLMGEEPTLGSGRGRLKWRGLHGARDLVELFPGGGSGGDIAGGEVCPDRQLERSSAHGRLGIVRLREEPFDVCDRIARGAPLEREGRETEPGQVVRPRRHEQTLGVIPATLPESQLTQAGE